MQCYLLTNCTNLVVYAGFSQVAKIGFCHLANLFLVFTVFNHHVAKTLSTTLFSLIAFVGLKPSTVDINCDFDTKILTSSEQFFLNILADAFTR